MTVRLHPRALIPIGAAISGRLGAAAALMAVSYVAAKQLPPESFARFIGLQTFAGWLAIGVSMGTPRLLLRAAAVGDDGWAQLRSARRLLPVTGSVAVVASLAFSGGDPVLALAAALVGVAVADSTLTSEFARGRSAGSAVELWTGRNGSPIALLAASGALLVWGDSLSSAMVVLAVATIGGAVGVRWWAVRTIGSDPGTSATDVGLRTLLVAGLPFLVAQLAFGAVALADLWLSPSILDGAELGQYAAAKRLVAFAGIPAQGAQLFVLPRIARAMTAGVPDAERRGLVRNAVIVQAVPGLMAAGILAVIAGPALRILFGDLYADAYPLVLILMVGQVAFVTLGSGGLLLSMSGNEQTTARVTVASVVLLLALIIGIDWVAEFDSTGLAWVSIGVRTLMAIGLALAARAVTGLGPLPSHRAPEPERVSP